MMLSYSNFISHINKLKIFENNARIAVGVSGGVDSITLVYLLSKWAKINHYKMINKIFEYSAAGKPCVMTNFNYYLNEYEKHLFISKNLEDFISNIITNIEYPPQKNQLKKFASKYDWEDISKTFHSYLMAVIDE